MTKLTMAFVSMLMGAGLSFSAKAANIAKETIHWGVPSESSVKPLLDFKVKPLASKDSFMLELLRENLPQYQHEYFTGNVQRILMELQKSTNTCFTVSLEDRSRLEYAYWTSYAILPPPLFVTRKDVLPKLKLHDGKVSLVETAENKKLKGATGISRSFGPELDALLKKTKDSNLQRSSFDFFSQNVLEMINTNRIDYTIEHRFVYNQYSRGNKFPNLVTVPIVEAKNPLTAYVLCSRSPLGHAVIEKIDRIIRENVDTIEYKKKNMLEGYPADNDADFEIEVNKFAKERMKKAVIE